MATFPYLSTGSTNPLSNQSIQVSKHGDRLGLGSTGVLLVKPEGGVLYPLKPEAGAAITATTADTIGNYGVYKTSSSAVSAIFTLAPPVAGCEVTLVMSGTASTATKFVTSASAVTFGSSVDSFSLTIGSSLFFTAHTLKLVGMSSTGYRVSGWVSMTGSTILPVATT